MKKILSMLALLALLFVPTALLAQNTTVAGTVKDSLGNPYSYGSYSFIFVPGTTVNQGTGASTATKTGTLTAGGAFTGVVLGDLAVLGGGSFWNATVCTVGNTCFYVLLSRTYIYGASADISAVLSAAALPASGTGTGLTFGAATGAGTNMYTFTDTANNTGTGAVLDVATASGSAAKGLIVACGAQAASATPVAGKQCITFTGGNGGASNGGAGTGANGGTLVFTTGAGGASSVSAATGGNGGLFTMAGGLGGAASTGAATGGIGGAVSIAGGVGGGTITGGAGGGVSFVGGAGGNGSTAGGAGGGLTLGSGAPGTGGAPTPGAIAMNFGANAVFSTTTAGLTTVQSRGTNQNLSLAASGTGNVQITNNTAATNVVGSVTTYQGTSALNITDTGYHVIPSGGSATPVPAGALNVAGKKLRVHASGVYTTAAASLLNVELSFCTVQGCGSGTTVTPVGWVWTTTNQANLLTNGQWTLDATFTTATTGASATGMAKGVGCANLGTATSAILSCFGDVAIAVSAAVDLTVAEYVNVAFKFSSSNAGQYATMNELSVDLLN